jgi:hypothetical protein
MFGRDPGPDDLIIPSRTGKNRSSNHMLEKFHQDLERLGIRAPRQHDLQWTFISLCLGDGGRSDILRWVTHSRPKAATIDDYTTLVWNPLCEEVAKLRIAAATSAGRIPGGRQGREFTRSRLGRCYRFCYRVRIRERFRGT